MTYEALEKCLKTTSFTKESYEKYDVRILVQKDPEHYFLMMANTIALLYWPWSKLLHLCKVPKCWPRCVISLYVLDIKLYSALCAVSHARSLKRSVTGNNTCSTRVHVGDDLLAMRVKLEESDE